MHRLKAIVICCVWTTSALGAEPTCRITEFGILDQGQLLAVKPAPEAATGKEAYFKPAPMRENTDRIPARIGIRFGVKHEFLNIDPASRLTVVLTHPPMKTPSGEVKTVSRAAKNPRDRGTAYGLNTVNEVLPGQWTFQFEHQGSVLCEKTFTVYEE